MTARAPGKHVVSRHALVVVLVLTFVQDSLYALLFLSYMNHYVLDVLHTSPGVPGYTLAFYGGVKLVVHPVAGRVIDRHSPRFAFRTAIALQSAAVVLLLVVHSLASFLAATVLLAAGSAIVWPLIYHTIAATQGVQARPRVMAMISLAAYAATAFGFGAGVMLGRLVHRQAAFAALGALVLSEAVLLGAREFTGRRTVPETDEHPIPPPVRPGSRVRALAQRPGLLLFALVAFFDHAAVASIAGAYGPFVRLALHISLLKTMLYMAPAGVAALLGLYASSRWSHRDRRFLEMAFFFSLAAVGALALAAAPGPAVAGAAAVPLAVGVGGIGPLVAATMMDAGGDSDRGLIIGALMSIEGLGGVIGPAIVATSASFLNPRAGVATIGLMFLVIAPVALWGSRGRRAGGDASPERVPRDAEPLGAAKARAVSR